MTRPCGVWSPLHLGCLALALLGSSVARADQCQFIARTGAKVSPRSGNCSLDNQAVKNGTEVCTREGRTISETTFRGGAEERARLCRPET